MTKHYLTNITADSLSGMIFAFEGVDRSVTLLNGPTGCKFYHAATADYQTIRQREFDPLNYPEKLFFGQPRVPCTWLDSRDYVYGSGDKLEEALHYLGEKAKFDLIAIVNSPGASLIGDDLAAIVERILPEKPFVAMESCGFSLDLAAGFDAAICRLIEALPGKGKKAGDRRSVNLLGLSVYHRNFKGDVAEIKRLLALAGIEVNCALGAACDLETIRRLGEADLNIVLHREFAEQTAEALRQRYGTPYFAPVPEPVGFKATEQFVGEVCRLLDAPCGAFAIESEKARAQAYIHISRLNSLTGLPKGVDYALEGTYSGLHAYAAFLSEYFGMPLAAASVLCTNERMGEEDFRRFLRLCNAEEALERDILSSGAELVFGSGNTIAKMKALKREFCGIEIALPTMGYVDVLPKTHLGLCGALQLTEAVINGLLFR